MMSNPLVGINSSALSSLFLQVCPKQHCSPNTGLPEEICHPWFPAFCLPHWCTLWEGQKSLRGAGKIRETDIIILSDCFQLDTAIVSDHLFLLLTGCWLHSPTCQIQPRSVGRFPLHSRWTKVWITRLHLLTTTYFSLRLISFSFFYREELFFFYHQWLVSLHFSLKKA